MSAILRRAARLAFALSLVLSIACRSAPARPPVTGEAPRPEGEGPVSSIEGLEVTRAPEEVVVTAWAEPSHLPPGGGMVQILVRAQKRGGAPFPGVEVRLKTNTGSLYSADRVLVTDRSGMTRDRLTARRTAEITMNAGGTRHRFLVPVLPSSAE
jgi:uncharacterized protein (DUF58 family)